MIRVLLADDHPVVRQGLKQMLEEESDIKVVAEASQGQQVVDQIRQIECDVVLLDITMPGRGGLDILKQLKEEAPALGVLILTMHSEDQYAVRTIKAGADGFLNKAMLSDEVVQAVRMVARGRKYITPSLAEALAADLGHDAGEIPHERLSDREYQILCLIASGKTVGDVARELSLSVKTISTHRAHILKKMQLKNNAELIHYAIQNQLVD